MEDENQYEMAARVAAWFDESPTLMDLLDALASCGLRLADNSDDKDWDTDLVFRLDLEFDEDEDEDGLVEALDLEMLRLVKDETGAAGIAYTLSLVKDA